MPAFASLTEVMIRQIATDESFQRGRSYHDEGAVLRLVRRGDQIAAEVQGSQYEPYRVSITLGPAGIVDTACSCPYDWGSACKHVVAALLTLLHQPERVDERPPIEALLDRLDRQQLRDILLALIQRMPDLANVVETQVPAQESKAAAGPTTAQNRPMTMDPRPYRRQVTAALHSLDRMRASEAYWHVGGVADEVRQVAEQARPFLEVGDGRGALAILDAVTDEYVAGWSELDDSDGDLGAVFADLGELWTEAILSATLTLKEREEWAAKLATWQEEVADYGIDDAFATAAEAARQGWDDPELQRILRGEKVTSTGVEEVDQDEEGEEEGDEELDLEEEEDQEESNWDAGELAVARLRILERQGRTREYLNLARATGQRVSYATMLVRLGRIQDATEYGLADLTTAEEALALAGAMHERGATPEALRVADHGLTLSAPRVALARWLRDQATAAGRTSQALGAALVAVRESPSLADYEAVQALAGERWSVLRAELLAGLRASTAIGQPAKVDIFLHEGLIDDAIAVADAASYSYALVEKVVDAAIGSRPAWASQASRRQAEPIMDAGKSQQYQHAIRWLGKARAAYLAAGREAEWSAYLNDLLARHARKYSLVPGLKGLL
jgi:uncharacterized Zn finger protein